ncbi:MAG: beta-lactamase family protein [Lachnospira sp.]|nr:beta-lactamase family protein [Lachnospira sp.]
MKAQTNSVYNFETVIPETCGISSKHLTNFLDRLDNQEIPIHSAIIMRHGKICMETYYKPYDRSTLHRMFSITKSFVSLAIGFLCDEGKLNLNDHIVDYFPEKQPEGAAYEYTKMLTIQQMLSMQTCHNSTTYKFKDCSDWVGSFFTVKPSHVPGTNFSYDTSSTHVLGALVEKLTGMELMDYLRLKFLDKIGFSKDAYILKDPCNISMGGSGMCATPYDILKVIYLISQNGVYNGEQLLPANYVSEAVKKHSDPYGKSGVIEEMQGYGYQIWRTRHDGYALYGMGGQLALYVPDKDIIMVITADTQGRQGGVQAIYDSFWEEIYYKIQDNDNCADISSCHISDSEPESINIKENNENITYRDLFFLKGDVESPLSDKVNNQTYICDDNSCNISKIGVSFTDNGGTLKFTNSDGQHTINFGFNHNVFQQFPVYDVKCGASAVWKTSQYLLIKVQFIDYCVGSMYIALNFLDDYVTVMFRKIEESLFNEYNGVFSGHKEQ